MLKINEHWQGINNAIGSCEMDAEFRNLEKRSSVRRASDLKDVTIILDGKQFKGVVEDECANGLKVISASEKSVSAFVPESRCQLTFLDSDQSRHSFQCEVRWVHINKTPTHGYTYRMGMEIIGRS